MGGICWKEKRVGLRGGGSILKVWQVDCFYIFQKQWLI